MRFLPRLLMLVSLAAPLAHAELLDDVHQRGALRIALEGTYPPFNFKQGGKLTGFETELGELLAAELAVKPEFVTTEWSGILAVDGEDPVQPVQHFAALAAGDLRWRAGRRQASGDLRAKGDDPPLRMPAREQVERAMAATVVAHQVAQQATADQNLLHGCSTPLTGTQSSPPLADGHAR